MAADWWNEPWGELRSRPHIVFATAPLPPPIEGVYWPRGRRAAIILDVDLNRVRRRCALGHELVHDDRGGGPRMDGMPRSWSHVMAKEERIVDRLTALHLVPVDRLREFVIARSGPEQLGVTVWEVAEEFDVTDELAETALRQLALTTPDC